MARFSLPRCALLQRPGARGLSHLQNVPSDALTPLHAAWPAPKGALAMVGEKLVLVSGEGGVSEVLALPPGLAAIDATWQHQTGLTLVGLFEPPPLSSVGSGAHAPQVCVWPPPAAVCRELRRYTSKEGWVTLATVGQAACRLSISPNGLRAAWCEPNAAPLTLPTATPYAGSGGGGSLAAGAALLDGFAPRADGGGYYRPVRGEFYALDIGPASTEDAKPVTEGAEQCVAVKMAPDASGFLYLASHSSGGSGGGRGGLAEPLDFSLWWQVRHTSPDLPASPRISPHLPRISPASRPSMTFASPFDLSLWRQVWEGGAPPVQLCVGGTVGRILAFGWAPPTEDEEYAVENDHGEEETEVSDTWHPSPHRLLPRLQPLIPMGSPACRRCSRGCASG